MWVKLEVQEGKDMRFNLGRPFLPGKDSLVPNAKGSCFSLSTEVEVAPT